MMIFLATGKVDCAAAQSTLQLRRCCDWSQGRECLFTLVWWQWSWGKVNGSVITLRELICFANGVGCGS